jgi:hypothetical protein
MKREVLLTHLTDSLSETFKLCRQWTPVLLKVVTDLDTYIAQLPKYL